MLCVMIQGWHVTSHFVPLTFSSSAEWHEFLSAIAGYMSRLLAILKHTTLQLSILTRDAGEELRKLMDEVRKAYSADDFCKMLNVLSFLCYPSYGPLEALCCVCMTLEAFSGQLAVKFQFAYEISLVCICNEDSVRKKIPHKDYCQEIARLFYSESLSSITAS